MNSFQKLFIGLVSLQLVACGFTLRGSQALPENLTSVAISAPVQYAPLARTLSERLPVYQLNGALIDSPMTSGLNDSSTVVIQMQPENLERRLLSLFSSGQVAEYELIYSIDYIVSFPDKEQIEHSLTVSREYQEDPDRILAKSRELEIVIQEMRDEVADRMIRLLSSQYSVSVPLAD